MSNKRFFSSIKNKSTNIRDFANASSRNTTRKISRLIDPFYWMAFWVCRPLLGLQLDTDEANIIELNLEKYRRSFRVITLTVIISMFGLLKLEREQTNTFILSLLVPALISGIAWFSITFGGVQKHILPAAIGLTQWLFTAFALCLILVGISLFSVLPLFLALSIIVVFGATLFAMISYDNVDSLKMGLDDTLRRQSYMTMAKLGVDGVWPPIDSEKDMINFVNQNSLSDDRTQPNDK